jgi:formate/nitrite transporter FocA (FNT family)
MIEVGILVCISIMLEISLKELITKILVISIILIFQALAPVCATVFLQNENK